MSGTGKPFKHRSTAKMTIQWWNKHNPSRAEALRAASDMAYLLQAVLPVALRHIGKEGLQEQFVFWMAVTDFNRETDLIDREDVNGDFDEIDNVLAKWGECAEARMRGYTGDLDAEDPEDA